MKAKSFIYPESELQENVIYIILMNIIFFYLKICLFYSNFSKK